MELTQARVRELFDYREDGSLVARTPRHCVPVGKVLTGSPHTDGYRTISIDRKLYLFHRVIFLWHKGFLPKYLDHVDRDKANNRIENLREASHSQNMANRAAFGNKTGYKGVTWKPKLGKFEANIRVDRKPIFLGSFATASEAHAAYLAATKTYFGAFAAS